MTDERTVGVVLYPGFESLDVYGPVEAFGCLPGLFRVLMVAERPGPVASTQGPRTLADHGLADCPRLDVLLVPGGLGTREQVENRALLDWLERRAEEAQVVASVCTGSWLLARAGLLDGRRATTNKMFFAGAREHGPRVTWVPKARWVEDGKFVTSSGVSAGTDMALHVVARLAGRETADNVARAMEYEWHTDAAHDPFAAVWGLA
jgi:transcriptional regulator GlxA family with amidase domain